MSVNEVTNTSEYDKKMTALMTNMRAVRAIASAVEGTIGPKGLDTMLVDGFGDVMITNDGVAILEKMDVNHPAAQMVINIARGQQEGVGDGTTTATIIAGALIVAGVEQVIKGVPVARIIEGIKLGIATAQKALLKEVRTLQEGDDDVLWKIAYTAGRENNDIAGLIVEAAKMIGRDKFLEEDFRFHEAIAAQSGADNEVFRGVLIDKKRLNRQMPERIEDVKVLLIEDELRPEELGEEALATEAGFRRFMELKEEFKKNLEKILSSGANFILIERGIDDYAEAFLADHGLIAVTRVGRRDMRVVADHSGAKSIKRSGLEKSVEELKQQLGHAAVVYEDQKLKKMRLIDGQGKSMATVLVGATTEEVVDERERIAKDAASAVQAAIKKGYVSGGGSCELALARAVEASRREISGMAAYGLECVAQALREPVTKIIENAGFNPLEKLEEISSRQVKENNNAYAMDCDTGEVVNMLDLGVLDPYLVKQYAIKAAGEIAVSILRIDTIIRMKRREPNMDMNNR